MRRKSTRRGCPVNTAPAYISPRRKRSLLRPGKQLLPDRVTPNTLRRTYASLALAAGRNPRWVMGQLGHADARVTLSIYAQVVQRQATDQALIWRLMRFAGEPETGAWDGLFGPTNGPMSVDLADGTAGGSRSSVERSA